MERHNIKPVDLVAFFDTEVEMPMPEGQSADEYTQYMEKAPKEICLVRFGKNAYTIDGKDGEYECNEEDADNIINNFTKRGKEIVIDREHSTLNDPQNADANGWIKVVFKKDDGIYGQADWQPEVAKKIVEKKLRYLSPVIDFNGSRPFELHSVALTNHPATHSPNALAASDTSGIVPTKSSLESNMELLKALKDSTGSSLKIIRECYSDIMKEVEANPEKAESMKAFTDSYFPELMIAFADATGAEVEANAENFPTTEQQATIVEVPELERIMTLPKAEAIVELETLIAVEDDPARKQVMLESLNVLKNMPDEKPVEQPVVDVNQAVAELPANPEEQTIQATEQAFCDRICKETGLDSKDIAGLVSEIKSIKPVADKAKEFLKIHSFSDFSLATTVMLKKEIDTKKEVQTVKETVALNDTTKKANELVQKALSDKKILGSQKDTFNRWAMSDYAGAETFLKNQKPIYGSADVKEDIKQSISIDKTTPKLVLNDLMDKYKKTGSLSYEESKKFVELTSI